MIWQTESSLVFFSNRVLWVFLPCGIQRLIQILLNSTKLWISVLSYYFGFFWHSFFLSSDKRLAYHSPSSTKFISLLVSFREYQQISTDFWKAKSELPRLFQTYSSPSKAKIAACLEGQVTYDTCKKKNKRKKNRLKWRTPVDFSEPWIRKRDMWS